MGVIQVGFDASSYIITPRQPSMPLEKPYREEIRKKREVSCGVSRKKDMREKDIPVDNMVSISSLAEPHAWGAV
jgi:hypothetical protein